MPFISKADLLDVIRPNTLAQITTDDATIARACAVAESHIRDRLSRHYALDQIFSETGDQRHPGLVDHARNIAIYTLYKRVDDDLKPTDVVENYQNTMQYLLDVANGELAMDLPRPSTGTPDAPQTKFRGYSEPPRSLS